MLILLSVAMLLLTSKELGFTLICALRKVGSVRMVLCCGCSWRTFKQYRTVLFTWNQQTFYFIFFLFHFIYFHVFGISVSLLHGHDRAHVVWESQSWLFRTSLWVLIHRGFKDFGDYACHWATGTSSCNCGHCALLTLFCYIAQTASVSEGFF